MSTKISSMGEWSSLLSNTEVVVADFYADWCGPCKMIGPHFDRLAQEHSKPKKMAFAKIDTEQHNDISGSYGVRSLPTFKVFHKGACIDTVTGADPSALAAAINKAKNLVGSTTGEDMFKSSSGRVLGGKGVSSGNSRGAAAARRVSARPTFNLMAFLSGLFNFIGLYFVSLFALDSFRAADKSMFSVNYEGPKDRGAVSARQTGNGPAAAPSRTKFKTFSDL